MIGFSTTGAATTSATTTGAVTTGAPINGAVKCIGDYIQEAVKLHSAVHHFVRHGQNER